MNPFTERYRNLKSGELIEIINNPEGFQDLAIEAAHAEIERRNLSDEERREAVAATEAEQKERRWKDDRKKAIVEKIGSAIGTITPVQPEGSSAHKQIMVVAAFLALNFLIRIFATYRILPILFEAWDVSTFFFIFSLLFPLAAAILFWIHSKAGWILSAAVATYKIVDPIIELIRAIASPTDEIVQLLFPPPPPLHVAGIVAIWSGCLWVICKTQVREIFGVNRQLMFSATGVTGGLVVLKYILSAF